ncbi:MAG: FecR domain-containing protein [Parvibaculaceae bacterium]|nr:FecR domain-containing protein [Parvibaculaceae bacterium]
MTDDRNSQLDPLKRDARRWVRQLASGEATTADAEAVRLWRQQSSAHEAAFVEAVRLWKSLGSGGRAFIGRHGMPVWSGQTMQVSRRAFLGGTAALAAAAAAYVIVDPPADLWLSFDELNADYRTGTGEQRHLTVADIVVQMNTQTSIAVPREEGAVDRVKLIAGEAAFTMPQQSGRPLMILAGGGRAVASRARFEVRNIAANVCVTCLEGQVQVEQGAQVAMIGAGQQLSYDGSGLGRVLATNLAEATSWQDGFIVFRYTPLSAAVAEVNRYRPGRVILLDEALGRKTVSGRFRIDRIDEVLVWIGQVAGARSRSLPGGVVLLS